MEQTPPTMDETIRTWMEAHAAGVREAWLLEALNHLAWDCFDDPWELCPSSRSLGKTCLPLDDLNIGPAPGGMRQGRLPMPEELD